MFEFKRFPMLDADDGLDIGGTGAEEPEVAEPVIEEGVEEPEVAEPVKNDSVSRFQFVYSSFGLLCPSS